MSMMDPLDPFSGRADDDGIPAADPGPGAPPTAEGFGVPGEQPDRPAEAVRPPADSGGQHADPPDDPPFRTPQPDDVGPEG